MMYVIYHSPCFDGFCARWVAHAALGDDGVRYIGADYGDPLPEIEDPEEADVVLVDVSWPRGDLLTLRDRVRDLVVLDHHRTARDALQGLDFVTFDMDKSGARLAWEFFHPGKDAPALVRYVEDRDLWRFQYDETRAMHAFLSTYPFEISAWDDAANAMASSFVRVIQIGERVLRYERIRQEDVAATAHRVVLPYPDEHDLTRTTVLAVNLNIKQFVSETLHLLLDRHDDDVVASYHRGADGMWNWSLRSREGVDCSRLALRYGGGGHAQAAGFRTARPPIFLETA